MPSDSFSTNDTINITLEEAFPDVGNTEEPLGARVLVQLRRITSKTKSGIFLIEETQDTAKWNNQIAKVIAVGPLAYRNRETHEVWPEGAWVKVGDFVRVPRWNGDRKEVLMDDGMPVMLVTFKDAEIISKINGNPLHERIYVL